jgi:hypothetical protein
LRNPDFRGVGWICGIFAAAPASRGILCPPLPFQSSGQKSRTASFRRSRWSEQVSSPELESAPGHLGVRLGCTRRGFSISGRKSCGEGYWVAEAPVASAIRKPIQVLVRIEQEALRVQLDGVCKRSAQLRFGAPFTSACALKGQPRVEATIRAAERHEIPPASFPSRVFPP